MTEDKKNIGERSWLKQGLPLAAIILAFAFLPPSSTRGYVVGQKTYLNFRDLKDELARRQDDLNRMNEKIQKLQEEIDTLTASRDSMKDEYEKKLRGVRKQIIVRDQISKGNLLSLMTTKESFHDTLMSLKIYNKIMKESISRFNEVKKKHSALEKEIGELSGDLSNQNEIRAMVEKRKEDLMAQLEALKETYQSTWSP